MLEQVLDKLLWLGPGGHSDLKGPVKLHLSES